MAKREMPSKTRFILAAVYAAVAVMWFFVGVMGGNDWAFIFSLVWAALSGVWVATGFRQQDVEAQRDKEAASAETVPIPAQEPPSLLAQGERAAAELHRLSGDIQNPAVRAQTQRLEGTTRKILAQIVLHPEKQSQVRQFTDYYLPTSIKVLDAYRRMEDSNGPEIQALKDRVEGMLDGLCAAFDRQLDALLRDEVLDISADLTVMEQMLRQEGFGGDAALIL